jgi:hypothetical protein
MKLDSKKLANERWPNSTVISEEWKYGFEVAIEKIANPIANERDDFRLILEKAIEDQESPSLIDIQSILNKYPK